jgi:uncharacterized membrane protein
MLLTGMSYELESVKPYSRTEVNEATGNKNTATAGAAKIIYILYLISIIIGITAIVGLIMAYVNRDDAPQWLKSHYQFQIRTFWIGALYLLLGVMFSQFFFGLFIILFWVFWLIVRCAKGIKYLDRSEAYPDTKGWLF